MIASWERICKKEACEHYVARNGACKAVSWKYNRVPQTLQPRHKTKLDMSTNTVTPTCQTAVELGYCIYAEKD